MTAKRLRRWFWLHKWTSLVCTAFLLMICLTGLPLIFSDEIGRWLDTDPPYATVPPGTPAASLDRMVEQSRQRYPGQIVTSVFIDDDEPQVLVYMAPSWQAVEAAPAVRHYLKFDAHTGLLLREQEPPELRRTTFMALVRKLHTDLFARLPGELFLGAMGLLFVVAIVSGVVLYGPFMSKLEFGTVRAGRARRIRWLDLHNLLGIVALAWTLVVGATGVLNELATPLFALWQRTDVSAMLRPYRGSPVPRADALDPVQAAVGTAARALPGMTVISAVFPGAADGSPYHYVLWTKGGSNLTSRLFTPVLVDARTGELAAVAGMPWYLRALELSRPLHFGDYGGLPLKLLWTLFDLATIAVLGSGLYLWFARRKAAQARIAVLAARHAQAAGAGAAGKAGQP